MSCVLALIWLPLLAAGAFIGFNVGGAFAGETGAIVGLVIGVLASHLVQGALWGDRSPRSNVPPPWWTR